MFDDFDLAMKADIDATIERRAQRGKRLANRFADLPRGLTWTEFLMRDEIADLELDFITARKMYDAYCAVGETTHDPADGGPGPERT